MTMEAMVKCLEQKGFDTKKRYLSSPINKYEFTISKGNDHQIMLFEYPAKVNDVEKDILQREFIDRIVDKFNKNFSNKFEADVMRYDMYGNFHRKIDEIRSEDKRPEIKDVIFNEPATIVLWKDGTKTVVKCGEDDIYDPEKGLTMAITKKLYGNKGSYFNEIKKWTDKYWEKQENVRPTSTVQAINLDVDSVYSALKREIDKLYSKLNVELSVKWPSEKDPVEDVNKTIEESLDN